MNKTLFGVIVGGLLVVASNVVVELIRGAHESSLDTQKRKDDRQIGRDVFQRNTLVAVQDAANDLARAIGRIHHHDAMAFKGTGKWRSTLLGAELSETARLATTSLGTLQSRVLDPEVRRLAASLSIAYGDVTTAETEAEAEVASLHGALASRDLIERAGELIRSSFTEG